ncbi:protein kinase kinase kinase [Nesidiocoris tenuis]|uniref:mitogen-activated protein kinase kinase kinase n=1 Tax=Nesidiocoris tenuis TaxID=355587 RepID=A0ABN7A834_9HEMI|nr:protein kinase kinase kinase [Nesidiocoris tenuis]
MPNHPTLTVEIEPATPTSKDETFLIPETHSVSQESFSSHHSESSSQRAKMDVVCVIDVVHPDHLAHRKTALDEIKQACLAVNGSLHLIQFEKLDFGETNVVETFYNADVAIVDLSIQDQQRPLSYHLGIRESFDMKENLLLYNDINQEASLRLKLTCSTYSLICYRLTDNGICQCTNTGSRTDQGPVEGVRLSSKLIRSLQEVDIQSNSRVHIKEKFLCDLKKARDTYTSDQLREVLKNLRKRLDDPRVLCCEVVYSMLISFRDIQDYDSMVQLFEDLKTIPNKNAYLQTPVLRFLYPFALNRRNNEGDREKALGVIEDALQKKENHIPDMVCLCGRIYKDKFVESQYTDMTSLRNAIFWYRKGFEVQPNEYAGINLATLLVIQGHEFSKSEELQHIGMTLNNLIGKKGGLSSLKDYWDVATFFEISVLAEDYGKAVQAAACMFKLKPPDWYLKSTVGNITLINRFRKKTDEAEVTPEQQIFDFWMEYFVTALEVDLKDTIRFPVLILEPSKVFMPSYVTVNMGADEKSLTIDNVCLECLKGTCSKMHTWVFTASMIRSVSLYKRDDRCFFLYVHQNSDDFQMFFSSQLLRQRFYELLLEMTADQEGTLMDLNVDVESDPIEFEYEVDENGKKLALGKGTYGEVYQARDLKTQVVIAIKEIPETRIGDVQPLQEEIKLHSQLRHRNIVQYLGSVSEDGYFKIIMELVPGGSLSNLLRKKWGPLKGSESTIQYYTRQILEGLKYLHDQKIVHRDIKGDNVLVNTYSGVVKISDFGTSKRLAAMCPDTETFAGTLQYMAPEVIDKGQRGYGAPADIWSLGGTVVEMATGKPPFIELGSPQAALFKVGFYKMHPTIPEELSDKAKVFIKRCFDPDPSKRATASELLEDPFLADKKKMSRGMISPQDMSHLSRSVSVPADRLNKSNSSSSGSVASNNSSNIAATVHKLNSMEEVGYTQTHPAKKKTNSLLTPIIMPVGSHSVTSINTPDIDDTPEYTRRSSFAGGVMSPEMEGGPKPPLEQDQFYLTKKDSQRRKTLSEVLTEDRGEICAEWMKRVQEELSGYKKEPELNLTEKHLELMNAALRDYIIGEEKEVLDHAIGDLKSQYPGETQLFSQLQLALYVYQESVNQVLRGKKIKPHWMFALDQLLRSAVQAALSIISPELEKDRDVRFYDPEVTSSVNSSSTVNSQQTAGLPFSTHRPFRYKHQFSAMKSDNSRLVQEMIDVQKGFQILLKQMLDVQKTALTIVKGAIENAELLTTAFSSGHIPNNCQEPQAANQPPVPQINLNGHPPSPLAEWLQNLEVDQLSIDKFVTEEYSLEDVLQYMSREDLRRIRLRGGVELKIWKSIVAWRRENRPLHNRKPLAELSRGVSNSVDNPPQP